MATTSAKSGTARLGFLQIVVQQDSFKNRGLRSCMDSGINPPDCWGKEDPKIMHTMTSLAAIGSYVMETAMTHDGMHSHRGYHEHPDLI